MLFKENLLKIYQEIDSNLDGKLTRAEIILAIRKNERIREFFSTFFGIDHVRQEDGTRDDFEAFFQEIDADASRGVSEREFIDYLEKKWGTTSAASSAPRADTNFDEVEYSDHTRFEFLQLEVVHTKQEIDLSFSYAELEALLLGFRGRSTYSI